MKNKIVALYLPQFYSFPENDKWWGKGFTEWTNVGKAKPLFKGHHQPRVPTDLGYYNLRMPEVREQQAEMARNAGVEGFMYWHYWFGNGKRLMWEVFDEVLKSGKPDFPFCICWANHDWTNKSWKKTSTQKNGEMIIQMQYSMEDHVNHFFSLLPAFKDKRYITVNGKPLFAVWAPRNIPNAKAFIEKWQELAKANGLPGIHFVGYTANANKKLPDGTISMYATDKAHVFYKSVLDIGFDAVISSGLTRAQAVLQGRFKLAWNVFSYKSFFPSRACIDYSDLMKYYYVNEDAWENVYPTLLPQWDRTPRAGSKTEYLINSSPEKFQDTILDALNYLNDKSPEHRILFLKAWNEWGEGNYVEPDEQFGHGWLDAIRNTIKVK